MKKYKSDLVAAEARFKKYNRDLAAKLNKEAIARRKKECAIAITSPR